MKKKIASWLLTVVLALTLTSLPVAAAEEAVMGTDVIYAGDGSLVSEDGVTQGIHFDGEIFVATGNDDGEYKEEFKDAAYVMNHSIGTDLQLGVAWDRNEKAVYIGIWSKSNALTDVTLTVGGASGTVSVENETVNGIKDALCKVGESGKTMELSIPMTSIAFAQADDTVYTAMKLNVKTANDGEGAFDGKVIFHADRTFATHTVLGYGKSDYTVQNTWCTGSKTAGESNEMLPNGRKMVLEYCDGTKFNSNLSVAYNGSVTCQSTVALSYEADIQIHSLPVVDGSAIVAEKVWMGAENPSRVYFYLCRGYYRDAPTQPGESLVISVYNLGGDEGLMLVRDNFATAPQESEKLMLNKKVGDQFTIGFRWALSNEVEVLVDHEVIGTFPACASIRPVLNGSGWGFYCGEIAGTNMVADKTGKIDLTVTDFHMAKAIEFDADAFLKLAEPGSSELPVNPEQPGTTTEENNGQNTQAPEPPKGTDEVPTAPGTSGNNGTTTDGSNPEKEGCKSSASMLAVIGFGIVAAFLTLHKKREFDGK